jgi:uncharacterized surface protein with fasciclin (FAS1) repeats
MKEWFRRAGLIFVSVSLVGALTLAQEDTTDTSSGDAGPTVNVEALEIAAGTIADYLASRSASNPSEGGLCYDQPNENVAPEAADDTADDSSTDSADASGDTTDDTELAAANASYTCLTQALIATGLNETLSAEGTYTLFAPTDDAFRTLAETMSESEFAALLADTAQLTQILNYHVLPEERTLSSLYTDAGASSSPVTVTTLQGSDLTLTFEDEPEDTTADDTTSDSDSNEVSTQTFVRVGSNAASTADVEGDAFVVQETVDTDNGYVIGIDHVLMPEDMMAQ